MSCDKLNLNSCSCIIEFIKQVANVLIGHADVSKAKETVCLNQEMSLLPS